MDAFETVESPPARTPGATARQFENLAAGRVPDAEKMLASLTARAGIRPVTLRLFSGRGASYHYGKREVLMSRELLAFGSRPLIAFILAHELGHATQVRAKENSVLLETLALTGLSLWVLGAYATKSSDMLNSPGAFMAALLLFMLTLRGTDLWWELDADWKARKLTGYKGSLRSVFEEFLRVEPTNRMKWHAWVRVWFSDVRHRLRPKT